MKNKSIVSFLVLVSSAMGVSPTGASAQTFPSPDVTPPWVMRSAVTNITPFSATINWTTDEPADGAVEFCLTWTNCGNFTPLVPEFTTEHSINLSNLKPYTKYYFWVYSRDQWGNTRQYGYRTFMTAWLAPSVTPTPLPTPAPTGTPIPTPFPSQTPVPGPDVIPPWVKKWSVTGITPFAATINWTTDEPADARVEFCTTWNHCGNFTPLVADPTLDHVINLSGLTPGTRYFFWLYSRDASGNLREYGYRSFVTLWTLPTVSPTPFPTPVPTGTPAPTPFPSQPPLPRPDTTPPWVMRWTVTNITSNSARIEWITDEPADGQIEFCPSWVNCANFTPRLTDYTTGHVIELTGLTPAKRYYFWMYSRDAANNLRVYGYRSFNTAP